MPPVNDNYSAAVMLGSTHLATEFGLATGYTTAGATSESGEPGPLPGGWDCTQTVWFSFYIDGTLTTVPTEYQFQTAAATAGMCLQVYTGGSPNIPANLTECTYTVNNSSSVGSSYDAGVSVLCTPGTTYYIRVSNRWTGLTGTFHLGFEPYQVMSLGSCANCPPKYGPAGCFETLVGTIQITNPYAHQQSSFGIVSAGRYWARYCNGAFFNYLNGAIDPITLMLDSRPIAVGYYVANQPFTVQIPAGQQFPNTIFIYQNSSPSSSGYIAGPGVGSGITGSPIASFGTIAICDIPAEDGTWPGIFVGATLGAPVGPTATGPFYGDANHNVVGFLTETAAQNWARCGKCFMAHTGGNIYLDYDLLPDTAGVTYGASTDTVLTGSVTWGLYKITPQFAAVSVAFIEDDTTTSDPTTGANEFNYGGSPQLPIPNATQATFYFSNIGELEYDNVTVTLTGVSNPSGPQTLSTFPPGTSSLGFAFTTPTTPTTATLTFTDNTNIGETLPSVTFALDQFLIIGTPTSAPESTCPTTITKITIPVKNIGTLATASTTRFDITYEGGTSSNPGMQLGTGCTTLAPGAVTFLPGAIAAGATVNLYLWCANQPSGTYSSFKITPSLNSLTPGLNEPPIYEFTYTWP